MSAFFFTLPDFPCPNPRLQPPPAAHVRQGQLSLRVELTPPESKYVGGGGVFLDSMEKTITPGMGSGLVLPAKLRRVWPAEWLLILAFGRVCGDPSRQRRVVDSTPSTCCGVLRWVLSLCERSAVSEVFAGGEAEVHEHHEQVHHVAVEMGGAGGGAFLVRCSTCSPFKNAVTSTDADSTRLQRCRPLSAGPRDSGSPVLCSLPPSLIAWAND